jgi:catechol 2,3-dioxygenase-like lactoylglutathione lyase family enzyme
VNALVLSILVDDLEPVRQRAAELGIRIDAPTPMRPGLIGVALHDPNGNKLEFLQTAKT